MADGKQRYAAIKRLEEESKVKAKDIVPMAAANTMPLMTENEPMSQWEKVNRAAFNNYVPGNALPFVPNESNTGDVSLDRPMIIVGQGAGRREIPTDALRKIIGDNSQFFKGIDLSNYQNLQNSIQHAYRSGHTGVGLLDNLLLKYAQNGG